MSATPRPWKLFMLPPTAIVLEAFLFPADEEGNLVGQAVAAARDEVIAGRILRAVNAHDALVGALEWALDAIGDPPDFTGLFSDWEAAKAALKAAKA